MNSRNIVLVGQPNAGKSTLFNVLSDIKTSTSNFAGTTVKSSETFITIFGEDYHVIDIPGTYSLNPNDEAERVTYNYLITNKIDLIVNIIDSSMLARGLELTIELLELGIPMIVALNMQDEAERRGVKIDAEKLQKLLNVKVVTLSALKGKGVKNLVDSCYQVLHNDLKQPKFLPYTHHIEENITELSCLVKPYLNNLDSINGSDRFYSIKAIENPELLPDGIANGISLRRNEITEEMFLHHKTDPFETISYERHHLAMKISEQTTNLFQRSSRPFLDKIDNFLLHPYFGYVFLIAFFIFYFAIIFVVGNFLSLALEGPLDSVSSLYEPLKENYNFLYETIDGAYQGFEGGLGIVLPYFLPLIFLTSLFEEFGYLARIAFLIDGLFHKIGLHGKSVVPFIMGFGCSVPALYATRIIEDKKDRTIAGMLIPFVPCSARISVIFALTGALAGPIWAFVVFGWVVLIIAIVGKILAKIYTKPTGLILEIPNLKTPSFRIAANKTYFRLRSFFREAFIYLVVGSIVLSWIEYFNFSQYVNSFFSPIIRTTLGLPQELGSTLVFGFLRKELVIVMAKQALGVDMLSQIPMTVHQVVVFMIFVTLYFPCLTTFIVIVKEFGIKTGLYSAVLSIILATMSGIFFKIILGF